MPNVFPVNTLKEDNCWVKINNDSGQSLHFLLLRQEIHMFLTWITYLYMYYCQIFKMQLTCKYWLCNDLESWHLIFHVALTPQYNEKFNKIHLNCFSHIRNKYINRLTMPDSTINTIFPPKEGMYNHKHILTNMTDSPSQAKKKN